MNDAAEVIKDMSLLTQSKTLLNDLASGKITREEFLSECAYWSLKFIDYYRFKPLPTKPQEIMDYQQRIKDNPNYEARAEFWRIPHVAMYLQSAMKIEGENLGSIGKLKGILEGLPEGDIISRQKVKDALREFKPWLLESKRLKVVIDHAARQDRSEAEKDFFGEA